MSKKYSYLRHLLFIIFTVLAFGFCHLAWSAPPEIYSITPDKGGNHGTTQVTIAGADFQPTPQVALYGGGGGPSIAGACDTPGRAECVYVAGCYAYVADGDSGLQIIDISDPENPRIAGACDTPGYARRVYVTGSYAYVADDNSGLQVIDISDPADPHIVGSCDTPEDAEGVYVAGSYAYVADGASGLQVIDISDPANPHIVGSCDTPDDAEDVYVAGSYAYVADGASGLQIIDISDPADPHIVGPCDTPGGTEGVYVAGSYAYMADGPSGLQVIDISDPADPHIVGSCDTPWDAEGVYVAGSYAYVADGLFGLQVIDISDPVTPRIAGTCDTPWDAEDVYVAGSYAYMADGLSGLQVIDISNLENPTIVGACDTPDSAEGVYIAGSYAYVADDSSGLQVIEISDPANPSIVGACDTPDSANGVYVAESYAYVACGFPGLQVIDISDHANPHIVGAFDTPGSADSVYIAGSYAYVADAFSGLQVIDISDPANPSLVGACDTPDEAESVYVVDSYAYVACDSSGLQVIDIRNPENPHIVGVCDTPDSAEGVYVVGSYAYVADWGSGLQVIDISDPANPSIVGACDTPGLAEGVYMAGSYAYVADMGLGLQVIDISDPANPSLVGTCDTPDEAEGVYVAWSYAYVADNSSGLQVIEKFSPLTDIQYVDASTLIATVPAGYRPGIYNLHVTNPNPDGGHEVKHNAFTVHGVVEITMKLPKGWSMISLPVIPSDASVAALFPEAVVVYGFEKGKGYVRIGNDENLVVGKGYWILVNDPQSYTLTGQPIESYDITIDADGWLMIGGCTGPAKASVETGNIVVIYKFTQGLGYQRVLESESLEPGKGYWILISGGSTRITVVSTEYEADDYFPLNIGDTWQYYDVVYDEYIYNYINDSSLLSMGHLKDSTSLAVKLRDASEDSDPLSWFLRDQFSQETQQLLDEYEDESIPPPESLQIVLIRDLNQLLQGPSLCDEDRFAHVTLSQEIQQLIEQSPGGEGLIRLNRWLLEAAYPHEIAESHINGTVTFNDIFSFEMKNDIESLTEDNEYMYFCKTSDETSCKSTCETTDGIKYVGIYDPDADDQGYSAALKFNPPVLYLKSQFKIGDTWSTTSEITYEVDGNIENTFSDVEFTVLGLENLTLPAGTFHNCIKIKMLVTCGNEELNEQKYIWLAKDVGEVKREVNSFDCDYIEELQYASVNGKIYGEEK